MIVSPSLEKEYPTYRWKLYQRLSVIPPAIIQTTGYQKQSRLTQNLVQTTATLKGRYSCRACLRRPFVRSFPAQKCPDTSQQKKTPSNVQYSKDSSFMPTLNLREGRKFDVDIFNCGRELLLSQARDSFPPGPCGILSGLLVQQRDKDKRHLVDDEL
eukprot:scaffold689_cov186-Amphora_coffeaeformis.AAC.1